jgi:DNA-binding NarL/FixJ family response regulator
MKKRIIVFDDEALILSMIKEIIEEDEDLEVSAGASETHEFLEFASKDKFDLGLMDISIGGNEGGLEILKQLREKNIVFPIIMLSAHDEVDYALKCLRQGAAGYINKCQIVPQLLEGIHKVLDGQLFVSGSNSRYLLEQYRKENPTP